MEEARLVSLGFTVRGDESLRREAALIGVPEQQVGEYVYAQLLIMGQFLEKVRTGPCDTESLIRETALARDEIAARFSATGQKLGNVSHLSKPSTKQAIDGMCSALKELHKN